MFIIRDNLTLQGSCIVCDFKSGFLHIHLENLLSNYLVAH